MAASQKMVALLYSFHSFCRFKINFFLDMKKCINFVVFSVFVLCFFIEAPITHFHRLLVSFSTN